MGLASACLGNIGGGDGDGDGPGLDEPVGEVLGRWSTRRLTKEQYRFTVQDVLGVNLGSEIDRLPTETRTEGFTNSALGLVVTTDHADGFFELAEIVPEAIDYGVLLGEHTSCQTLGEDACETELVQSLGEALFRRPLSEEEVVTFAELFDTAEAEELTYVDGAKLVIQAMLQSPQFLYQLEDETIDGAYRKVQSYEMASRLSYLIWQSAPDAALRKVAAEGGLDTREGVLAEAERMLEVAKSTRSSARFVRDWFALDALDGTAREGLTVDMARGLLDGAVATYQSHVDEGLPIASVLDTQVAYLPGFAAEWYGLPSKGEGVERYELDDVQERVGILSHPGTMTTISDRDLGGLVARGLFVMEHLMCRHALTPPPDLNLSDFTTHLGPEATERAYSEDRMANNSCKGCHLQFDPLAYAFERFDGIGRYQTESETGQPLFSDGEFIDGSETYSFETVDEYVSLLAESDSVQRCVTKKHLMFALGHRGEDLGPEIEQVHERFIAAGGTYEAMVLAIVAHDVFRTATLGETP